MVDQCSPVFNDCANFFKKPRFDKLLAYWLLDNIMRWSGDLAIITGRYVSEEESTVIELWARARTGESVLLRVQGMRPWIEITPSGSGITEGNIESVRELENVVEITESETKWTYLGMKPVWKVYVSQPYAVPKLRNELQSWTILSGDIPFVNRFFLDGDLSMHVSVEGNVVESPHPVDICLEIVLEDVKNCQPFPAPFKVLSFDLGRMIIP